MGVVATKVDKKDLLERYEATGDEAAYLEALPLYEQAIIGWSQARGYELDTLCPKQQLARLQQSE